MHRNTLARDTPVTDRFLVIKSRTTKKRASMLSPHAVVVLAVGPYADFPLSNVSTKAPGNLVAANKDLKHQRIPVTGSSRWAVTATVQSRARVSSTNLFTGSRRDEATAIAVNTVFESEEPVDDLRGRMLQRFILHTGCRHELCMHLQDLINKTPGFLIMIIQLSGDFGHGSR